jgi:hypothetical protein
MESRSAKSVPKLRRRAAMCSIAGLPGLNPFIRSSASSPAKVTLLVVISSP